MIKDFIKRISSPIGRLYWIESKELLFPSVTTILSVYEDLELKELEAKLGPEKWKKVSLLGSSRGTCMHLFLENYFIAFDGGLDKKASLQYTLEKTYNELKKEGFAEMEIDKGRNLFYNFYWDPKFFNDVKKIEWSERFVYSTTGLYAGAADFGYSNWIEEIIGIDYKSSSQKKKDVPTYKMQISAYSNAIHELTGKNITRSDIMIASEVDSNLQIFSLNPDEMEKWYGEFLKLRDVWFDKNATILEKEKEKLNPTKGKLF